MTSATHRLAVCALVPYVPGTTPSQRFRLEQWLPNLRDAGIDITLEPFADATLMAGLHQPGRRLQMGAAMAAGFWRRLRLVPRLRQYDVVVIHRAASLAGPALIERLIAPPIVFDFDDAIYLLHTSEANRLLGWLKFPGKTGTICRLSAQVVAGNQHLAEFARRYNPSVTVIPSSVDTNVFHPVPRQASGRLVIGWTGSATSQAYLRDFAPVLRRFLETRDVEMRVHSDREPELAGVPFVWRRWTPDSEASELSAFDVGIMPMPDDAWARGKCSMKALLYMAMGVPAVCSPVGTNRDVIRHGENGLLASTPDEWVAALQALIDDAALRARIGAAGRVTVEQSYSRAHCAALFAAVLRRAAAGAVS